jgi:hypothetical protein
MLLLGGVFSSQRRALGPRHHKVAWMLTWRLGVGSGSHGFGQCLCRRSVGHTSRGTLEFGALFVDDIVG